MMNRCEAVIRSPWRMGMTVKCERWANHGGLHRFTNDTNEVHWTGQDDRATEQEREMDAKRELRSMARSS